MADVIGVSGDVVGLNVIKRKLAGTSHPVMEIQHDGEHFNIKTTSAFSKQHLDYKCGEAFNTDRPGITDEQFSVS